MPRSNLIGTTGATKWRKGLIIVALVGLFFRSYYQIDMIQTWENEEIITSTLVLSDEPSVPVTTFKGNVNATFYFHSTWKFPISTKVSSERAIALLSMGPAAAKSTLLERCIISIRKRGQFLGTIFVLTDAPLQRYETFTSQDPNFIVLQPKLNDWNWELRRDMPYKRFKTYLLEYLHRDSRLSSTRLVYYLDIDIVIGQPLFPWFEHVERKYLDGPAASNQPNISRSAVMIFFDGNISPLQGGQFLVQKGRSEGCLTRWRFHMDNNPTEHKDQPSLTLMWKEQHSPQHFSSVNCTLLRMPQEPYLRFISTKEMSRWVGAKHDTDFTTLMHIKNTQHASTIPDAMQKEFFQNLLELSPDLVANITGRVRIRPNRTWSALQVQAQSGIDKMTSS